MQAAFWLEGRSSAPNLFVSNPQTLIVIPINAPFALRRI
jgi:hypothetical protein